VDDPSDSEESKVCGARNTVHEAGHNVDSLSTEACGPKGNDWSTSVGVSRFHLAPPQNKQSTVA
jgi:hypothetical protein